MEIDFPEELLLLILIRLPASSLLRCRCVSKLWYSLISSLDFIDSHHRYQSFGNQDLLYKKILLSDPKEEFYSFHTEDQQFHKIETFKFPFKEYTIVGCVNGLICLENQKKNTLLLWNPSIRKYLSLPEFEQPINGYGVRMSVEWASYRSMCFGFGYDALSNDFKVVMLVFTDKVHSPQTSVIVYSLAKKSWNTLPYCPNFVPWNPSCNLGRFLYGFALVRNTTPYSYKIVSFDLSTEEFKVIALPINDMLDKGFPRLTDFRNSLGLIHRWDSSKYHVWVMREDGAGVSKSWVKLFSVELDKGDLQKRSIVGFTMNGLMLVVGNCDLIVSPIVEDVQVVKYVPPRTRSHKCHSWLMGSFNESLILLNEGANLPPLIDS